MISNPSAAAIKLSGACRNISILNNTFDNSDTGIRVLDENYGFGANAAPIEIHQNSFNGITTKVIDNQESIAISATCNWFGTATPTPTQVTGNVTFTPALSNGADNEPATTGFQPVPGSCGSTPSVSSLVVSGALGTTPGCTATLTGVATGNSFVFTGPGGYVFSNVFLIPGTHTIYALDVKLPGTYTLTIYGEGGPSGPTTIQTIEVTGTACP